MQADLSNASRRLKRFFKKDTPLYASTMSLLACIVLACGSLAFGIFERSLVMQTNGYIFLIDIGTSLLFLAAIERSMRSPDMSFNYGYGKYESLAILVSAILLVILSAATIVDAVSHFKHPPDDTNSVLLLAWSVLSFVVMRNTVARLEKHAARFHQPMLHYDAALWRMDSFVEIGVVGGLIIGGMLQAFKLYDAAAVTDGLASLLLLVFTLKVPLKHGREAFRQLLDRTLPDRMQYDILRIIAENSTRMCEFKNVHTRQSGRDIFIEIDLVMPFDYTLENLYDLERDILDELHDQFPTAIPRVYVTPCDRSCMHEGGTTCPVKQALKI